ncbi:MAG: CoA transferase [Chloroflexi bacterium]|nr:CoA transferase [Chloroflexota bacterium]
MALGGQQHKKPLDGIRVLELTVGITGPYCGMILADNGAEVIKIERPGTGDHTRRAGRFLGEGIDHEMFIRFNRNKKSVVLDLQQQRGKETFVDLIKTSDVMIENFRPGAVDDLLGLGYDLVKAINPSMVYLACSGFGRLPDYPTPWAGRPALDIVIQAMAGLLDLTGEKGGPPLFSTVPFADLLPGIWGAFAVTMGLRVRDRTGEGDLIDMSMFDCIVSVVERALTTYSLTGRVMTRGQEDSNVPWGVFRTKDGYIGLLCSTNEAWHRVCGIIGKQEWIADPRLATATLRYVNSDVWEPGFNEWLSQRTSEETVNTFLEQGYPCGAVSNIKQVYESEHVKGRRMLMEVDHPRLGKFNLVNTPVRFRGVDPDAYAVGAAPPLLGQHTQQVLIDLLAYSQEEMARLKQDGVLG